LPDGGIAAVNTQDGTYKWISSASDKPLGIVDGLLISQQQSTQSAVMLLVYHDLNSGDSLNNIQLTLPDQVRATVVDGASHRFNVQQLNENTPHQLQWTFSGGTAQGIAPVKDLTQSRNQEENDSLSGAIDLDTKNRTATISNRTFQVVNTTARIEQAVMTGIEGRQFLSQDESHVLISNRIPSDQKVSYQWRIFDRTGQLLSSLESPHSYAPFVISGSQLLLLEPATGQLVNGELVRNAPLLKAVNLGTGKESWSIKVRPIAYFGPLPV